MFADGIPRLAPWAALFRRFAAWDWPRRNLSLRGILSRNRLSFLPNSFSPCCRRQSDFRHDFQVAIAAVPNFLAGGSGKNDASFGGAAGMLLGIAVHEEAAAPKGFCFRGGIQSQDIRAVIRRVDRRPTYLPVADWDRADVLNVLHLRIVLAAICAGVASRNVLSILLEFAGFLGVGPSEGFEVEFLFMVHDVSFFGSTYVNY